MANPFVRVKLTRPTPGQGEVVVWPALRLEAGRHRDGPGHDLHDEIQPGEGTGGGLMKQMMPGAPSSWLAYVVVDDVKASTAKANRSARRS